MNKKEIVSFLLNVLLINDIEDMNSETYLMLN